MYCVFIPEYEGDHCFVPVSSCFATYNDLNRVGKIASFKLCREIEKEKTSSSYLFERKTTVGLFYNDKKME